MATASAAAATTSLPRRESKTKRTLSPELQKWFDEIKLTPDEVMSALTMGVKKKSDLLLFTPQELVTEFGFSVGSVAAAFREKSRRKSNVTDLGRPCAKVAEPAKKREARVRALYSFAAIKPTHLNAECWEEFTVLNDVFDWWLCRNDTGEVGLLPSNYLQLLDDDEGLPVDDSTELFEEVLPTWEIRKRIKEICHEAVETCDIHRLTYIRVKKELEQEFGDETFANDKEHVKEMLRRAQDRMQDRYVPPQAEAEEVIRAAEKFSLWKRLGRRRSEDNKGEKASSAPPSNGLFSAEAAKVAEEGLGEVPPIPRRGVRKVDWVPPGINPPELPPRNSQPSSPQYVVNAAETGPSKPYELPCDAIGPAAGEVMLGQPTSNVLANENKNTDEMIVGSPPIERGRVESLYATAKAAPPPSNPGQDTVYENLSTIQATVLADTPGGKAATIRALKQHPEYETAESRRSDPPAPYSVIEPDPEEGSALELSRSELRKDSVVSRLVDEEVSRNESDDPVDPPIAKQTAI